MISYIKVEDGFEVRVPFSLKDAFRLIFKTAKWDSEKKCWQIGIRAESKLIRFIEDTKSIAQEIDESEKLTKDIDDTEYDAEVLNKSLKQIQSQLEDITSQKQKLVKVQQDIESIRGELNQTKSRLEEEKKSLQFEKEKINELLSGIVNINRVLDLRQIMLANHNPSSRTQKEKFLNAQQEIKSYRDKLKEVGLKSNGIDLLYYANINRPDRDSVLDITLEMIYDIKNITENKEN